MQSEKTRLRIGLIGECMVELKANEQGAITQKFSGDTLNTAVYLSRLLQGKEIEVSYISAIGEDPFSEKMLSLWQSEGLLTTNVRRIADKQPGLYFINVDQQGERSFTYWRNDSAAKYVFSGNAGSALLEELEAFDALYLSGISLAILPEDDRNKLLKQLKLCRSKGCKIIFDNNYRPVLWDDKATAQAVYSQVLALTDMAILTWDDEILLHDLKEEEHVFKYCTRIGIPEVVLKRGADACLIRAPDGNYSVAATLVENVVDTTAAGDSFSAAFVAARMLGLNVEQAALCGHRLAGKVIQHVGGVIDKSAMPDNIFN